MTNLLKVEEKLLKRLFSKRQQELLGYISSLEKRTNITFENASLMIEKHNRELSDLRKLEKKLLGYLQ
jgi:hypothetical protein